MVCVCAITVLSHFCLDKLFYCHFVSLVDIENSRSRRAGLQCDWPAFEMLDSVQRLCFQIGESAPDQKVGRFAVALAHEGEGDAFDFQRKDAIDPDLTGLCLTAVKGAVHQLVGFVLSHVAFSP
jgi:hypothetical protein